jgi:hypothetical protein
MIWVVLKMKESNLLHKVEKIANQNEEAERKRGSIKTD